MRDDDYTWHESPFPDCPECCGDGEMPGGIAGEYEVTCPRCGGAGVEYDPDDDEGDED